MIITCRECGKVGEQAKGQGTLCPVCSKTYQKAYRAANKERLALFERNRNTERRKNPEWVEKERKRGREYWAAERHRAMMAYGGYHCACCGETEPMFLSLDHVNNDGAEHRRELGYDGNGKGASSATLSWLRKNNYPEGFQILCMNCNCGKARNGGVCPHKSLHKQTA